MNNTTLRKSPILVLIALLSLYFPIFAHTAFAQDQQPSNIVEEWVQTYTAGETYKNEVTDAHVDRDGNVYVTGWSKDISVFPTNYNVLTLKYDASGTLTWSAVYDATPDDLGKSLAVGTDGSVYVVGDSGEDLLIIKYSPSGLQEWRAVYTINADFALRGDRFVALDKENNVYITSSIGSGSNSDILVLGYSPSGTLLWEKVVAGSGGDLDEPQDIAIFSQTGEATRVFVVAEVRKGFGNNDIAIYSFDSNGTLLKEAEYTQPYYDTPYAMALDRAGTLYVVGESNQDALVLKYGAGGRLLWSRTYNGGSNDSFDDVAVDLEGNVYATGRTIAAGGGLNSGYLTAKYDSQGNQLWQRRYDGPNPNGADHAKALTLDRFGNVYVTGDAPDTTGGQQVVTIAYDSNGVEKEQVAYNPTLLGSLSYSWQLGMDRNGSMYVVGQTASSSFAGYYKYLVIKYRRE